MHTCISLHGLERSWRSCPRRMNAGNKNTPRTHHPRRRNVTTLMVGLKKRSHTQKSHPKVVNPRDIAGERKKKKKKKKSGMEGVVKHFCHLHCLQYVWLLSMGQAGYIKVISKQWNVTDHFSLLFGKKSRVSNQNGVSPLYIMLEIHHPGRESSK